MRDDAMAAPCGCLRCRAGQGLFSYPMMCCASLVGQPHCLQLEVVQSVDGIALMGLSLEF
jgi:hypothetical protein